MILSTLPFVWGRDMLPGMQVSAIVFGNGQQAGAL